MTTIERMTTRYWAPSKFEVDKYLKRIIWGFELKVALGGSGGDCVDLSGYCPNPCLVVEIVALKDVQ